MKFDSVRITNFLSIGEADVKLGDRGLLLIQGRNLENGGASSNGAGKSSLVDAVFWCLYGKTARGVTTDDVVNDAAGKDCSVVLTIHDGADTYRVARHRKHAKHKNRLTLHHNGTDVTKGTDKQTQEAVNRIVGASESVFANSVYAGQERMPDLPSMTDKELKALVEEAAGIDRLNAAYQAQLKKANLIKREVEQQEVECDRAVERVTTAETQLIRYQEADTKWRFDQKSKAAEAKQEAVDANKQYQAIDVAGLKTTKKTADDELAAIQARIDATDDERKKQAELQADARDADVKMRLAESHARAAGDRVKNTKSALDNVDKLVGSPCGECGKPYHKHDLDDARSLRKQSLADTVAEFKRLKSELDAARDRSRIAQETLTSFEHTMTSVSDEKRLERETRSLIGTIDGELRQATALRDEVENSVMRYKELQTEKSPYEDMIADQRGVILDLKAKVEDANKALETVKRRWLVASKAAEVLGTSGVRAHILDHVTPALNDRTSHYLGQLSDGEISATWQTISMTKAGELRDKFAISVVNTKGAKTFGGLSGGEKRKVRIATAMALQDLVATRSSKALPLFIFDEIDHALDSDGLERLMSIMKEKATSSGTVLVISHNDLNHYISDAITVVKDGGLSRVED